MGFAKNYATLIGETEEKPSNQDQAWCTFDWGYGCYNRDRLIFLSKARDNGTETMGIQKLLKRFLPNLLENSVISSHAIANNNHN